MIEEKEYGINVNRSSEHLGDCLELMEHIPNKSIDMILCDLPYGTTACKWDSVIDFDLLWKQYNRIIKERGPIVLFGAEPFSSKLRLSNLKNYKYDWKWDKVIGSGFALAKKRPLLSYEDIMVFYKKQPTYNPLMTERNKINERPPKKPCINKITNMKAKDKGTIGKKKYPTNKIEFNRLTKELNSSKVLHSTQKPIDVLSYLIKTYTNENEIVLDNTAGVFSTAIACLETNRKYIVMEKEKEYYNKGIKRVLEWKQDKASKLL